MGPFEDDPNVTNKRFPGNPTQSLPVPQPAARRRPSCRAGKARPEVLKGMLDDLAQLREQGLDVIED
jgi:rifampin ADP-ribosylating transferase